MRLKGTLAQWDEDKAYGFITPTSGDTQIFVHKSAFTNHHRTPKVRDVITFTLSTDKQGRPCATAAYFAGEAKAPATKQRAASPSDRRHLPMVLASCWLVGLTIAGALGKLPMSLVYGAVVLSAFTFIAYAWDKAKAKRNAWRTPENTLHALAVLGGWPGAAFAQELLRHKSQKRSFRLVFWLTVTCHIVGMWWLLSEHGASTLSLLH
ncbi:DNA-binding protein [Neiella marina]|uniref:DNA-binding protein n=1 Tax=Neiella marina TaxID=508461 RepID=A0A8J2XRN9_9GAMM|nr:cold shock and DUF1294 domain-containing protein [Neiella marina]GGA87652.1 DNA-binding protein [Neiella marina]